MSMYDDQGRKKGNPGRRYQQESECGYVGFFLDLGFSIQMYIRRHLL